MGGPLNPMGVLSAQARSRMRRTAAMLVDDSSLRDDLTDDQARQLLDWAMARLTHEAIAVDDLNDEDAGRALETTTATLRQVMRSVNLFMSKPHNAAAGGLDSAMEALVRQAAQLTGNYPDPARLARAEILGRQRAGVDVDAAFERIMALMAFDANPMPPQEAE